MIRIGLIALVLLVACSSDGKDGAPATTSASGGSGGGTAAAGASGSGTGGSRAGSGGVHGVTDAGAGGTGGMHGTGTGGMHGTGTGGGSGNAAGSDAGTKQDAGAVPDAATNNSPDCPATYAELLAATTACSVNLVCAYPEGFCNCFGACGGIPPDPKLPPPMEKWGCSKPAPGCPIDLPETGDACERGSPTCIYGSCCVRNATCNNGVWLVGSLTCPP